MRSLVRDPRAFAFDNVRIVARPFESELVRQTDSSGLGTAFVFLEEGSPPISTRMASTESIMDPVARCVNSRIVEHEDLTSRTQLVDEYRLLAARDAV